MSIKISTGAMAAWLCTGSLQDILENGVIDIYSGSQPSSADDAETGDKLATITVDGGAFTPGSPTNGLNFDNTTDATLSKTSATWEGDYLQAGTMGWFRYYANAKTTGSSTTAVRVDGTVGTSTRADAEVASLDATVGGSASFNTFTLNFSIV